MNGTTWESVVPLDIDLCGFTVNGIFIPNPYSIADGCVEVEMQLEAKKLTQNAETTNLSVSGSIATSDVHCCPSSCIGIETSPTKHIHLISPIPERRTEGGNVLRMS